MCVQTLGVLGTLSVFMVAVIDNYAEGNYKRFHTHSHACIEYFLPVKNYN